MGVQVETVLHQATNKLIYIYIYIYMNFKDLIS